MRLTFIPPVHLERPARLAALVRHLPFDVDDFDAARQTFVRWRQEGDEADRQTALLWTYCYVAWYFYGKFARERTAGPSDLDAVIERSCRRIFDALPGVRDPERFPQFVSVVCRNVLSSYRLRRRESVEVQDDTAPVAPFGTDHLDRVLVRRLIVQAIDGLPPAVSEVARMRLLENRSYQEIADATGRALATTRTYYSKAIARLREDPDLQAVYGGSGFPGVDRADESAGEVSVEDAAEVRSAPAEGLRP